MACRRTVHAEGGSASSFASSSAHQPSSLQRKAALPKVCVVACCQYVGYVSERCDRCLSDLAAEQSLGTADSSTAANYLLLAVAAELSCSHPYVASR